jgi:hypothetical protein
MPKKRPDDPPAGDSGADPSAAPPSPPAHDQNQRLHPRRSTRLPASLSFSWGELAGTIENIGAGGVFFVTGTLEGAIDVGDRAALRFTAPDGAHRCMASDVLRVERYFFEGDLFRALALRFREPCPLSAAGPSD